MNRNVGETIKLPKITSNPLFSLLLKPQLLCSSLHLSFMPFLLFSKHFRWLRHFRHTGDLSWHLKIFALFQSVSYFLPYSCHSLLLLFWCFLLSFDFIQHNWLVVFIKLTLLNLHFFLLLIFTTVQHYYSMAFYLLGVTLLFFRIIATQIHHSRNNYKYFTSLPTYIFIIEVINHFLKHIFNFTKRSLSCLRAKDKYSINQC